MSRKKKSNLIEKGTTWLCFGLFMGGIWIHDILDVDK